MGAVRSAVAFVAMLDPDFCDQRQKRLLIRLAELSLDAVVIGSSAHVYYFSAHRPFWLHLAGFILFADGRSWLCTANQPAEGVRADQVQPYEAQWFSTNRQEQPAIIAEATAAQLRPRALRRIGIDASTVSSQVALQLDAEFVGVDAELIQIRRHKFPDELALMRRAIDCCDAMYRRAREILEPGISEVRMFSELHAAAVAVADEALSAHLGNDYAAGERGGPARSGRVAKAGQIYILDVGPAYRGYFSDNCRSLSVDRKPTDAQMRARQCVADAFPLIEQLARPGVRCREIVSAVNEHLISRGYHALPHHLGHGVGLEPHESPHLNPRWDDVLMEGDVIACEPGVYAPGLDCGIRIENQYRVRQEGLELLTPFSMDL